MMRKSLMLAGLGLAMWVPAAARAETSVVPSTQPSATAPPAGSIDTATLQLRANEAFAKGDYAAALPLLKVVSARVTDQPDALGMVMEQIRVCERQLKKPKSAVATTMPSSPGTAAETRVPHPALKPGESIELAIKELGNFEYDAEKGGGIPADVQALSGHLVKTHGFMIPLDQAENISEFALVPSLFACCFGQPPQIQHTIVVHCPKGKCVNYYPDELSLEGTLHVVEKRDGGFIVSIFEMDATSVKPMAK